MGIGGREAELLQKEKVGSGKGPESSEIAAGGPAVKGGPLHCLAWDARRHSLVVGANGQRQAMFLENTPGLAKRILRNYDLSPDDSALVASSSGCNVVPIEIAQEFQ